MDARSFLQVCACLRQMFTGGESCVIASCVVESYVMQSDAMWPAGTAKRRAIAWTIGGLLVLFSSCRPPQSVPQPARLPEPGVYVLRLAKGVPLPADLKPKAGELYSSFERVLAGWLYLTPDGIYKKVVCSDLIGSTDRGLNTMDRQSEGAYWAAGGRVYFSDPVTDAMPDSIAVGVHGDTVEFVRDVYVRDRASVIPRSLVAAFLCAPVRGSLERGRTRSRAM
jgi:hypothetical protein